MKRSEINGALKRAADMAEKYCFRLPDFGYWKPEEWQKKGAEFDEIRKAMLGWDVTDYGEGDFANLGLTAFTIRNGMEGHPLYQKPYAEKLLFSDEDQHTPCHFHWSKMEDIINRAGGNLVIQLYNSTEDEGLADSEVRVSIDGEIQTVAAGGIVILHPGQSISLTPGLYHEFCAEKGSGTVMLGEVSMCNDDNTDNRFFQNLARFAGIVEDEAPLRLLCNEYPEAAE